MEPELELKEKIANIPDKPGVYLMKNKLKKIIYVGKAISLRKRVKSYFSGDKDVKTAVMVKNIADIEVIITDNEYEALLLENNLIKQWHPRYNINLKDGKTYPVIRITNEQFPRIFKTRRIIMDGSLYYGPFPNVNNIDVYLKVIESLYPLRKCRTAGKLVKRSSPCLYYHIGRCLAPCCGKTTAQEYKQNVEKIKKLLSGDIKGLIADIEAKMRDASAGLEYEKAAQFRDQIKAISEFHEAQRVVDFKENDRDYIGFFSQDNMAAFMILQVRNGKLVGREKFQTEIYSTSNEAVSHFILQYYEYMPVLPAAIYLPIDVETEPLKQFFKDKFNKKIAIIIPKRGKQLKMIKLAIENAQEDIKERTIKANEIQAMAKLQEYLGLPSLPRRIEGFDISHLSGKHMIGSMVSFYNSRPDKSNYRYFKIKSLKNGAIDDFEAIREAVARRYTRILKENLAQPDLILIDGGKGQLSAAYEILCALNMSHIPVIGLAKKLEEIFKVGEKNPIMIDKTDAALRLLIAVRDESHRFGVSLNRRLRTKDITESLFEKVKGIGPKKSKELITLYGTPDNILKESPESISKATGLSIDVVNRLIGFIKGIKKL